MGADIGQRGREIESVSGVWRLGFVGLGHFR